MGLTEKALAETMRPSLRSSQHSPFIMTPIPPRSSSDPQSQPQSQPQPKAPPPRRLVDDPQVRSWLKLRAELTELNTRLEYLRLMVKLGVRRID
ncbi:MAG TPA: hypothetical protein VGM74_12705 [Burkholderiaceae bacterium]|jgi:hypothetical protein